jgi:hypothetical protein
MTIVLLKKTSYTEKSQKVDPPWFGIATTTHLPILAIFMDSLKFSHFYKCFCFPSGTYLQ